MDLTMMYAIRDCLRAVKKEMEDKGLTFDEVLKHFEEVVSEFEKRK